MELISEGTDKINTMKIRELERKLNLQRKQETKKLIVAENEQLGFFEKTFKEKRSSIEIMLKQAEELDKVDLPSHLNAISKEILLLQKYVAASSIFLRTYSLQKCQIVLQELSAQLGDAESRLIPKKKFGFKNKPTNKPDKPTNNEIDVTDSSNSKLRSFNIDCGFFNRLGDTLTLTKTDTAKKDVFLENLKDCTVYIQGYPSTLHLNHLNNCKIFSGPISTSIFAENCHKSTLVIACQQLRLHSSTEVDIYLHVTSRAIMEDCTQIQIGPYNWNYKDLEEDFMEAGLDRTVNNWKCIDDFNWLNAEKHSPNWMEMDVEKQAREWS